MPILALMISRFSSCLLMWVVICTSFSLCFGLGQVWYHYCARLTVTYCTLTFGDTLPGKARAMPVGVDSPCLPWSWDACKDPAWSEFINSVAYFLANFPLPLALLSGILLLYIFSFNFFFFETLSHVTQAALQQQDATASAAWVLGL
jgi:hypothetical protein